MDLEMEIQWGISESLKPKIVLWPTDFRSIIVHASFVYFYKQHARDAVHTN